MGSVIGVVRVPVVGVLCLSREWRKAFSFPEPSIDDWNAIVSMRSSAPIVRGDHNARESFPDGQRGIIASTSKCLRLARCMSFYEFLEERMLDEARKYSENGVRHLLLDFSSIEYVDEIGVYWFERCLAESFKNACNGDFSIGIRSNDDNWSVDLACRFGYDAVFCMDSCNYLDLVCMRNRMTDGYERKQPRLFCTMYDVREMGDRMCMEGIEVVRSDDEDAMDEFGRQVDGIENAMDVRIPVVGRYEQEIMRGDMHSDMTAWGARDYIVVDREVRVNGNCHGAIDGDRLSSLCSDISKLM